MLAMRGETFAWDDFRARRLRIGTPPVARGEAEALAWSIRWIVMCSMVGTGLSPAVRCPERADLAGSSATRVTEVGG
jgi:hypothetical protein